MATVTLGGAGPITVLTLADDGTFQVERTGLSNGQIFPASAAPGNAGIFVRTADGTVFGADGSSHPAMSGANSVALTPVELTKAADGGSATFRATNGAGATHPFGLTQITTYRPGNEYFRVDTTLTNPGTTPLVLDVFTAADLFLAESDDGVGYHDPATGAVGGEDATGTYRIFVQPDTAGGGLASTAYREAAFGAIWSTIGTGGHFDNTILGPTGPAPYNADPNYLDNGAGLEWQSVTIAPGGQAHLAYYWSFGAIRSVVPLSGGLDPASDSGRSQSDGITNVTRPTFRGLASPGATVTVFATPGGGGEGVLGTATADATGAWAVTPAGAMADGTYQMRAAAALAGGEPATVTLAPLVIDTAGPTIAGLTVDPRRGLLTLDVRDQGGGVDLPSLADPAHYQFVRAVAPRPVVIGLTWADPGVQPNGTGAIVGLRTTSGRIGHGLRYQLLASAGAPGSGIRDLAGNALDGEYRGRFASGNGQAGGDFRIGIATDGVKVLPYRTVAAPAPVRMIATRVPIRTVATRAPVGPARFGIRPNRLDHG